MSVSGKFKQQREFIGLRIQQAWKNAFFKKENTDEQS